MLTNQFRSAVRQVRIINIMSNYIGLPEPERTRLIPIIPKSLRFALLPLLESNFPLLE